MGDLRFPLSLGLIAWLSACSVDEDTNFDKRSKDSLQSDDLIALPSEITASNIDQIILRKTPYEIPLETLVINWQPTSLSLQNANQDQIKWSHDLEETVEIEGLVENQKYLRVTSQISMQDSFANRAYDIGCIFIELKDNVTYDKQTWLRMATTGISGQVFSQVKIPLEVERESWKTLPELPESLSLTRFKENSIKSFQGQFCFRMDFTEAPAQSYRGQVVIQYLAAEEPSDLYDDDLPPAAEDFKCADTPAVLHAGQEKTFHWSTSNAHSPLLINLHSDLSRNYDLGTYRWNDKGDVLSYQAPKQIRQEQKIFVSAKHPDESHYATFCTIRLIPDDTFVIADDGQTQGLVGNVYKLAANTAFLPDYDLMAPVAKVLLGNLDVPNRNFASGFPGVASLDEWFGIRFEGRLIVPDACFCEFELTSDDGAILYINERMVIDNDGLHAVVSKTGGVFLSKGSHQIRVDYFQGPRYHIALQLAWRSQLGSPYQIIEPNLFTRP